MLLKVKKIIAGAMITAIIATGTIASGSAATYKIGTVDNFSIGTTGGNSFSATYSYDGEIVDEVGAYPTIFYGKTYSSGTRKLYLYKTGKYTSTYSYYFQSGYPAPTRLSFGNREAGKMRHDYYNDAGGGFRVNITVYQYT